MIERLINHPRTEAFITFMVDAFNRFLEYPKDSVVQHIVDAFGTAEAIRIAEAQVLPYLKLGGWSAGLLVNFNVPVLKNGIKRIVLNYKESSARPAPLR